MEINCVSRDLLAALYRRMRSCVYLFYVNNDDAEIMSSLLKRKFSRVVNVSVAVAVGIGRSKNKEAGR